jgi:acyl CoA:acetate/3-ketoacid CoA transferase beta subunit
LEKVPYITVPGVGVKTLVSTLGIFEKLGDDEEFSLTACLPNSKFSTLDKKIKNVKENCGWELTVAPKVEEISPPTAEELMTLRLIAPGGPFTRDRVENDEQ